MTLKQQIAFVASLTTEQVNIGKRATAGLVSAGISAEAACRMVLHAMRDDMRAEKRREAARIRRGMRVIQKVKALPMVCAG